MAEIASLIHGLSGSVGSGRTIAIWPSATAISSARWPLPSISRYCGLSVLATGADQMLFPRTRRAFGILIPIGGSAGKADDDVVGPTVVIQIVGERR